MTNLRRRRDVSVRSIEGEVFDDYVGKFRASAVDMARAEERLIDFWMVETACCILCSVDHQLELRLYKDGKLIALQPCATPVEGLELARQWRTDPPRWPPF